MRLSVAIAVYCLSVASLSAAEPAAAAIKKQTNIPAQELRPALQSLARDRELQVLYRTEVVGDRRTSGAVGELTLDEALTRLLDGTDLMFRYLDDKTVTIVPVSGDRAGTAGAARNSTQGGGASQTAVSGEDAKEARKKSWWDRFRLAQVDQGQVPGDGSVAGADAAAARGPGSNSKLEEIIVTATKRAENVQDVPLSIAVVSADDIDRRGLVNAEDYLRGIPAVSQLGSAFGGPAIIIRGIADQTTSQNFGSGPTVATYFGETPTTNSAGVTGGSNVDIKLVDIERVEVLRGPQGTAFGSSSLGGAVRTIPVAPKLDRFEGKVSAGYSATSGTGGDNYNVQAVGNIPLTDKLAIRATAYQYEDSGFYRSRAGSNAAFQAAVVTPLGAQAFASDQEEVGSYHVLGGRVAALFQASDDLRFTLNYLTQETELDGHPLATSGTYEQTLLLVAPEHVRRGRREGVVDTNLDIANAAMEYDLGWADLLATYSYLEGGAPVVNPLTASGRVWAASARTDSSNRSDVGEIRLATRLDGAWNFLAGLYAENVHDEYSYDWVWHGTPATNPLAPGGNRTLGEYRDQRDLKHKAAFGEASWEFLPGLTLTGGARAYEYERVVAVASSGVLHGGSSSSRDEMEASGTNFRANLSYKPHDDALVYAGWAQGFRLGKPALGAPPTLCDPNGDGVIDGTSLTIASSKRIDSDTIDNYELGGKFTLLDRRLVLDVTFFRTEWVDIPVSVNPRTINPSACFWVFTQNAGGALSEGVELQANVQLTDAFRVDIGGSWIHARLTEAVPAQRLSAGNRLPGSPEVNANLGLQYAFDIAGHALSLRADTIYVGSFYSALQPLANQKAGGYVKLDATARIEMEKINIDFFIRNLTNEDAFTYRRINFNEFYGQRLRPRTIGVQLSFDF